MLFSYVQVTTKTAVLETDPLRHFKNGIRFEW